MMDHLNTARHALSLGLTRMEVADHMIAKGISVADTFLALGAAAAFDREYVTQMRLGNRSESCVQVLNAKES